MYKYKTDYLARNMMWQAANYRGGKFAGVVCVKFSEKDSKKAIEKRLQEAKPDGVFLFGKMWATTDFDNPRKWKWSEYERDIRESK